ncbi:hypothetical protein FH609_005045 [Streptomyces sp. 3MP-14]|uniref:Uncharacterized protein n=1 Tax=Streptomyces mimosae TaxID=2586635 RepID=A0A5N6AP50_9ACTN|nr:MULTISPECIES: hypothetical protein [Streptomyces]KAB8169670.1 hypothetical protein FH607_002725 [Streptomyces mimosae]KAB8178418.1 hypothetical protein FH609_005045 [Streptomyces sp. 3MP-14]
MAPDSGGTVLSREEVDRSLARFAAEHEAIETSLLALQDHAGRRLLEGADLTGRTRERWALAERVLTRLWSDFDRLTEALETARELRARRRDPHREELLQLSMVLDGANLAVPDGEGGVEHLGWPELIGRMNAGYAQVLDLLVAADVVWSALPARIDLLATELNRLRELAHSVGVRPGAHPAGDELAEITEELTRLRVEVIADPLAFWTPAGGSSAPGGGRPDTSRYDRAARALDDIRREVDAVIGVRKDAEERLIQLRDVLSRADRTLAEARTARGEVLAKIAASEVPAVNGPAHALHEQLRAAADYRRRSQWHRLSPLLESLEQRAEEELRRARDSLSAVTAPLAVRAELRGRLDAWRARLARAGRADEPLLAERYDAARRLLWTAPCDLRAAETAVLRYQEAAAELLASPEEGPGARVAPEERPGGGVVPEQRPGSRATRLRGER